MVQDMM